MPPDIQFSLDRKAIKDQHRLSSASFPTGVGGWETSCAPACESGEASWRTTVHVSSMVSKNAWARRRMRAHPNSKNFGRQWPKAIVVCWTTPSAISRTNHGCEITLLDRRN